MQSLKVIKEAYYILWPKNIVAFHFAGRMPSIMLVCKMLTLAHPDAVMIIREIQKQLIVFMKSNNSLDIVQKEF